MIPTSVPVNEPWLDDDDKRALVECIETGWISSEGPAVGAFENQFSARVGRRHGIAVCNGSCALELAVAALGLGPSDEVIMPTLTIISCAAAVVRAGATPVLVDCDPATWNMRPEDVERAISPRTRAIMVVHLYGLPVNMNPVLDLARKHNLRIIEDAAEMHGQTYRGKPCGSFGDVSVFSFYPNKHVTTGEGGMLVTDDDDLASKARSYRNLCFQPQRRFVHEELGWNFRMTNLQAALGLSQLAKLSESVLRKRRMGHRYTDLLAGTPGLTLPLARTEYAENIYWVYGLVLDDSVKFDAMHAMRWLADHGVGTRPFFWPMHEQPVFERMGLFKDVNLPVASRLARRGFYIPSGLGLTDEQMLHVADSVKALMKRG